jgi:glycosyltransferase involved in cell wall biosynthesis
MTGASPRVTVVVPTFNSGGHLASLISSLDQQSLPPTEFEVVLVDDGSTDGTERLIDRIAEVRPNVRSAHIPPSGWPGKPRNVGLDLARGDFVFFVDHDDFIGTEALERMTNYGREHGSDVVIGREVRIGRGPWDPALFMENQPRVDRSWGPLWGLLTPHKMFRRRFLVDAGIRFPEGPRRLEDHVFLVRAYFAATTISVLGDYSCYYWVFHKGWEHSSGGIDPDFYYPFLEEVLDLVEAYTEPGPERNQLLMRWYSTKVLGFINGSPARWGPERREALLRVTSELARTRFADVDPYLPPVRRLLSHLLRTGRFGDLETLNTALTGVTANPRVRRASWSEGELVVEVSLAWLYADGRPVQFATEGDRVRWVSPVPVDDVPEDVLGFTVAPVDVRVSAVVHLRGGGNPQPVEVESRVALTGTGHGNLVELRGTATLRLAPRTADFGGPLEPGQWFVRISTGALGISSSDPVAVDADLLPGPALLTDLPVVPYATGRGKMALAVASDEVALLAGALPAPENVHLAADVTGARLIVDLPQLHSYGNGRRHGTLRLDGLRLPATLVNEDGSAKVESWYSVLPGPAGLVLELDGTITSLRVALEVGPDGTVRAVRPDPNGSRLPARPRRPAAMWRRAAGRVPGARWAVRAVRRAVRAVRRARR